MNGLEVIRAYRRQPDLLGAIERKVDNNTEPLIHTTVCSSIGLRARLTALGQTLNRWLGVRSELLGAAIVTLAAFSAVAQRNFVSGGAHMTLPPGCSPDLAAQALSASCCRRR